MNYLLHITINKLSLNYLQNDNNINLLKVI